MFKSQRTRRSPGDHSRYSVNCLTASREPACWRWTASAIDREDAARRAEALEAVLDLAPPQGGDPEQGVELGLDSGGNLRPLAQCQRPIEPGRGLGELALMHVEEGDRSRQRDRLEDLLERRMRVEP